MESTKLFGLVQRIWSSLCSRPLTLAAESSFGPPSDFEFLVTVTVGNNNNKSVVLGLTRSLASQLAAEMFDQQPDQLSQDDLWDAAGEITNMVADEVRALERWTESIGLPRPLQMDQFQLRMEQCKLRGQFQADSEKDALFLAVLDCA